MTPVRSDDTIRMHDPRFEIDAYRVRTTNGSGWKLYQANDEIPLEEGETILDIEPAEPLERWAQKYKIGVSGWMLAAAPPPDDTDYMTYWSITLTRPTIMTVNGSPTFMVASCVVPFYSDEPDKLDHRCLYPTLYDALFSLYSLYIGLEDAILDYPASVRMLANPVSHAMKSVLTPAMIAELHEAYIATDRT